MTNGEIQQPEMVLGLETISRLTSQSDIWMTMFSISWETNFFVRDDHTDSGGGEHRGRRKECVRRRVSDDG